MFFVVTTVLTVAVLLNMASVEPLLTQPLPHPRQTSAGCVPGYKAIHLPLIFILLTMKLY